MKKKLILYLSCILMLSACTSSKGKGQAETLYSGAIRIAVDESFKPIIEEELQVYQALNPEALITPIYCSEVEAVNLLLKDSVRLAITNRRLTEKELISFHTRKFFPVSIRFAFSGIALITHRSNPDSLITLEDFRRIVTGKITKWKELNPQSKLERMQVVFDNPNSGTVHYVIDSICQGEALSDSLRALKNNEEVIDYVATTPDAIGIIGANWIRNKADTTHLSFNQKVRVLSVSDSTQATSNNSYRPYQAYLALKKYPMTHEVYILINDPKGALPTGLMTFLTGERGQRIILKSGLVPATQPVRIINVKDDF